MHDGIPYPPVTSRAATAELERQRMKRKALLAQAASKGGGDGAEPDREGGSSEGSGRKQDVQQELDDQRGRAARPKGKVRGAE